MPQFDPTFYSSQIFWLLISFAILYISIAKLVLPRVRSIVEAREKLVNSNRSLAAELDNKTAELSDLSNKLRTEANNNYQEKLEATTKQAVKSRDDAMNNLKNKIDEMTKKSRQEVSSLIKNSETKVTALASELVKTIRAKIIN